MDDSLKSPFLCYFFALSPPICLHGGIYAQSYGFVVFLAIFLCLACQLSDLLDTFCIASSPLVNRW